MKTIRILNFPFLLLFTFAALECSPHHTEENHNKLLLAPDEIVFYSNGSDFSPVIVLDSDAVVTWTWADSTTSQSTTPTKEYGYQLMRANRLTVTPWSALQRINIGYDATDGGSDTIEFVADQNVSSVENLHLVAPFLKQWCSAYNEFDSLDFSNFVNIETIECVGSKSLTHVNLANTPKLRRICFEDCHLLNLDVSESPALEDLRGASNNYNTLTFSDYYENVWHICVRDNPVLSTRNVFNNSGIFPNIAELFIWHTNQQGELVVPRTNSQTEVSVIGSYNQYSSMDFKGALRNPDANGIVEMSYNNLTRVDIAGCIQIKKLDLSHNELGSAAIDQILRQVDNYGTNNGTIDLRFNNPPTHVGLGYIANLEKRGWNVSADLMVPVESLAISSLGGTTITTDKGTIQLLSDILPSDATTKSVEWVVINQTGMASISPSGLLTAERNGTVTAIAKALDGSGVTDELLIMIEGQKLLVESISITDGLASDTIQGIGTEISLNALVVPVNASDKSIEWSVENITGQADINSNGLLITTSAGLIKVTAMAVDGSDVSDQKEYVIVFLSAVKPLENPYLISIFPNPSLGSIQIHLDEMPSETVVLQVWNLLGQKLLEQNIFNAITGLSVNQFSPGTYLIVLRGKNWLHTQKLVF